MDGLLLTVLAASSPVAEQWLLQLLLQLAVILAAARVCAWLARRIGQPAVVGEIAAGLLLGPSVLGHWAPGVAQAVFPAVSLETLHIISQLGLVFVMFLVGLEFDWSHLRARGRLTVGVAAAGLVVPASLGLVLGWWLHAVTGAAASRGAFALFIATAMAITALPVLARMMIEMRIARTRLASITIAAAAMEDACGWILLAAATSLAAANFQPLASLRMFALTAGFCAVLYVVVRPAARRWLAPRAGGELSHTALAVVLLAVLLCGAATSHIGIFAVFGAFALGAVLSGLADLRRAIHTAMGEFATVFFLPVFFAFTGLRTDVGSLSVGSLWLAAALLLAVAVVGKIGGCALAGWWGGLTGRESLCVGVLMNTRGLMELVVANVGYDLGVIPASVYCMLVVMAIVTTLMTSPGLALLMRGTELEPALVASGFARLRTARGFDIGGGREPTGV
jgi:Kef-type K+ transport system membrane component KefB